MSIVKVIEVIASSEKSIEDALQQAVAEASKTIRNIDSVYVKDIKAHVKDGKIASYGLISKISFRLDENEKGGPTQQQEHHTQQEGQEQQPVPQAQQQGEARQEAQTQQQEGQTQVTPKVPRQESTAEQKTSEEQYNEGVNSEQEAETRPAHEKDFVPAH
jgi:flavin-binding protein dodecin